jgi:hypothetical protein
MKMKIEVTLAMPPADVDFRGSFPIVRRLGKLRVRLRFWLQSRGKAGSGGRETGAASRP